jgi:prepilin-type N-terminal cleavage/methylation domain-containing protein
MVSQGKQKGFTIVELLIVIVVIGILAAISIVAYTGITKQANINSAKSNASNVADAANAINAQSGSYPATATSFTNTTEGVTISSPKGVELGSVGLTSTNTNVNKVIYVANASRTGACVSWAYNSDVATPTILLGAASTGLSAAATSAATVTLTCS